MYRLQRSIGEHILSSDPPPQMYTMHYHQHSVAVLAHLGFMLEGICVSEVNSVLKYPLAISLLK